LLATNLSRNAMRRTATTKLTAVPSRDGPRSTPSSALGQLGEPGSRQGGDRRKNDSRGRRDPVDAAQQPAEIVRRSGRPRHEGDALHQPDDQPVGDRDVLLAALLRGRRSA
jgi:hypothetical protein